MASKEPTDKKTDESSIKVLEVNAHGPNFGAEGKIVFKIAVLLAIIAKNSQPFPYRLISSVDCILPC